MKRKFYSFKLISLALTLGLIMGWAGFVEAAAKKIILKLASFEPVGGGYQICWYDYYMKTFNQMAKGEAEVKMYAGATLAAGPDQYEAIRDGIADLGQFTTPYEVGHAPIIGVYELPFAFTTLSKEIEMHRELMKAGLEKWMIEHLKVKPLGALRTWSYSIWSNKPVTKLEGLKGLKMRVPGATQSEAMSLLGAVPVSMSAGEIYLGLQRGVIDATIYTPAFVAGRRIEEVVKYAIICNFGCSGGIHVMNIKTWNKLPKHLQKIALQAGRKMEEHSIQCIANTEQAYLEKFKKAGLKVITLTKEEQARWVKGIKPVWEKYAKENGKMGRKLLNVMKKVKGFD
ncbi:MAG: TRAP transporter substrate-binding protein [Candidatus Hodarchaeota archaeon]